MFPLHTHIFISNYNFWRWKKKLQERGRWIFFKDNNKINNDGEQPVYLFYQDFFFQFIIFYHPAKSYHTNIFPYSKAHQQFKSHHQNYFFCLRKIHKSYYFFQQKFSFLQFNQFISTKKRGTL